MTEINPKQNGDNGEASVASERSDKAVASHVSEDDPRKVEKLTKAGRDIGPDEGTE